eukprot:CAMPEP_0204382366 /NCGR_PEP_ID=MMETSP0469-20131031/55046_1 /ASSEMBLY_ACC=CAM_ASM_000384 /TAXON_ID=2969 /ORGANISM="Oxyrrhis marina" /LENGTH=78 /DNA_ID=CAMNT_0051374419 /DNA_START=39 /DNA_END=272 /DNA_ORIENTATION=+
MLEVAKMGLAKRAMGLEEDLRVATELRESAQRRAADHEETSSRLTTEMIEVRTQLTEARTRAEANQAQADQLQKELQE